MAVRIIAPAHASEQDIERLKASLPLEMPIYITYQRDYVVLEKAKKPVISYLKRAKQSLKKFWYLIKNAVV